MRKSVCDRDLRGAQMFPTNSDVSVQRSDGKKSLASVIGFNAANGLYKVQILEQTSTSEPLQKDVYEYQLSAAEAPAAPPVAKKPVQPRQVKQQPWVPPPQPESKIWGGKFQMNAAVRVKRSDGSYSLAFVKDWDEETMVYTLELDEKGSGMMKRAYEHKMVAAPTPAVSTQGVEPLISFD